MGNTLTQLGNRPLSKLLTSPPKGFWHEITTQEQTFEVIARPLDTGQTAEGWVLVIRDVTQERQIERRVQEQERLAAIGQLAAGIAHDFNNIMASITLYAQMMIRASQLSDRDRERMRIINQQALHASNLIQQILDFSRRAVLERRPLDLLPLLKEQVKLLERTLPEHIAITFAPDEDEHIVHADLTSMQQIIMNLALNARDAMPNGGNLHIEIKHCTVQSPKTASHPQVGVGNWIVITVTDTGTGIPPDVLPHIYEPFFTTKAPGKGSGLGLAQVWGIVKSHEGHIVESTEIGEGTCFTIYLPAMDLAQLQPIPHTISDEISLRGNGELIMVVEDNETVLNALIEGLHELNYQTLSAANGREALNTIEQYTTNIALIISDMVMPDMGGVALARALQKQQWTKPIIMLTGHPMNEQDSVFHTQGITTWLQKPVDMEQLAAILAQELREATSHKS
jgi:signal transduction histidine kinase/ActR/RegA family two-component response regulator